MIFQLHDVARNAGEPNFFFRVLMGGEDREMA